MNPPKAKALRFRQVHLDFHTSPLIPRIGAAFDKRQFQETLKQARVDSITCFSKCHHGLSYHPTRVGTMHPELGFDLLRAQVDACKEIGVAVPVYLSAGVDNTITQAHPDWRQLDSEGRLSGWNTSPLQPGFHKLCFNTPYLDYLCAQIEEACVLFPEADGIFLDIIFQDPCCCVRCMESMARGGYDPTQEADRLRHADAVLLKYYEATTAAVRKANPDMPVFHNNGHIARGRRDLVAFNSHLELESLPTGGWGYDHFPESAAYAAILGKDFLGMTGKFHTSWGEFGGFKHPNALRYECAAMVAYGAKCSVGDQLHPEGRLDASTYGLIGAAYAEVEAKEPWCRETAPVADVAILSVESVDGLASPTAKSHVADTGACRILLEGHHLFALLDTEADFAPYKVLVLPDAIRIPEGSALKAKLDAYLRGGGKLLLSGKSGLGADGKGFLFDVGAAHEGESPFSPDFLVPAEGFRAGFVGTPLVMYTRSERVRATTGRSLGQVFDPYFNRAYDHFCSHQHTPNRPEPSGYDAGTISAAGNVAYLAHPVFSLYAGFGAVAHRDYVLAVLDALLGAARTVRVSLPSQGRVTLRRQEKEKRSVLHLLHANKHLRGGKMNVGGSGSTGFTIE
ncbi:MAG TPA: alpha-amylase family protein, partial [Candidatus Methylacidiphilales bacterium]